jgi:prevent-host-death family protein
MRGWAFYGCAAVAATAGVLAFVGGYAWRETLDRRGARGAHLLLRGVKSGHFRHNVATFGLSIVATMAVEVGIRELRADLSRWIGRVRAGEEVVVTDRGRPVARIVPSTGHRKLDQLIAEGRVTPAKRPWTGPPPKPIKTRGTVSDLVGEQRR